MDDITQQNAALAEQAAASSISMHNQANDMNKLLSFFKVDSKGIAQPVKTAGYSKAPVRAAAKPASHVLPSRKAKIDSGDEWEEF